MPLLDSNLQATWDRLYAAQPLGQLLHYERAAADCYFGNDVENGLLPALVGKGLIKGQRIVFVGAAFGWVAEKFIALGYGPAADGTANGKIAAVDTSTWIQNNKTVNGNATLTIVNADVNAATGRRTIRQQFGSNNATVDWCITEDVLPLLSDSECGVFASAIRQLVPNVAHWISVGVRRFDDPNTWAGDPALNWKTIEDWKALMSPDIVIQRHGGAVL